METSQGPVCESCGMPLSRDEQGGGTNADGSKSTEYCSHCYQNGNFVHPNMQVHQMVERVRGKLADVGVPIETQQKLVDRIPMLKRWI